MVTWLLIYGILSLPAFFSSRKQQCFFPIPNQPTNHQIRYDDEDEDEGPQPDSTLEQGVPIPVRMQGSFPPELASTPLEDIDSYYANQRVSFSIERILYEVNGIIWIFGFMKFE